MIIVIIHSLLLFIPFLKSYSLLLETAQLVAMEMIILLQTENYDTVKNKQQKQKNAGKNF